MEELKIDIKILKYDGIHNHFEQEYNAALSFSKYKIKKEIKKSSIPFNIKPKRVFNQISQDIGFICPEFKSIKSQIIRDINKQLPPNISSFEEIPEKHYLYITKQNENFMIFKNRNVIIFQSPFQAFLFKKYSDDLFVDGTFYIAPDFSYQIFITRNFVPELNEFYTTSFSILRNKEQETYKTIFEVIKSNCNITKDNGFAPKNLHCDFERAISNTAIIVFPDITIRYCIWHYKQSLRHHKNKICYNEVNHNRDLYVYYNAILNLPFINPNYILDIFHKIKKSCIENNYNQFLIFLEYFRKTYLIHYDIENWNYYNNIEHITNNASESYNNYIGSLFLKKSTYFRLIYTLNNEISLYPDTYERRMLGVWNKQKRKTLTKTNKIKNIIESYKKMESFLIGNERNRSHIAGLWFECLINLNNKIEFNLFF
ncbi:hypothetical protein LY90DRAFT_500205 [Neocallimastix californiae]|uniref:MULE transposase domain-containing protein n=1 Tax=Neocallimastix californiae TaxID=1754190 RepID=A0A1Y2FB17_9FUNG|nr:hypothetical protein LY90DRAFT_500205 [Neocallimastix californiae]|eukprot:ORY81110.1 hypothetical protein LY90DRAFT_500205 [Neocallimastix californiae]